MGPTMASGATKYCIDVQAASCNPRTACCNMGFHKVKLLINAQCQGAALRVASYDNQTITAYSDPQQDDATKGVRYVSLRLNAPTGWNPSRAGTSKICFTLTGAMGPSCSTLPGFCYGGTCQLATFNSDLSCCPVQSVAAPTS